MEEANLYKFGFAFDEVSSTPSHNLGWWVGAGVSSNAAVGVTMECGTVGTACNLTKLAMNMPAARAGFITPPFMVTHFYNRKPSKGLLCPSTHVPTNY
eukprot:1127098-Amphidinium_carterae.1